ncbi:hypothetical protein [uncultured Brevundimonas sp.]|uniref:hypothetical protein n=1 Tax=uncultured Brevundimonas sp. TaxID=213418 RepID=UPI0025DFD062|nr:hypothetical protein [uncultured Brevundimonas sp.]
MMQALAANIKFVAFTPPGPPLRDASALWTQMVGSAPQSFQTLMPPPGAPPIPGSIAQGALNSGQGALQVQFGRIEFTISPHDPGNPAVLPTLTSLESGLYDGLTAIKKFGQLAIRIGLMIEAYAQCESEEAANELVAADIPALSNIPTDALDLSFSINRRVKHGAIEINRIARWTTGSAQFVQFQMTPGHSAGSAYSMSQLHFAQLSADVNTVPLQGGLPLPLQEIDNLWEALAREARGVLSDGYAYVVR